VSVSTKKTFSMVIFKSKVPPKCTVFVNGKEIQQVESFSYMGSVVTSDGRSDHDIKQRIGRAKTVFGNTKKGVTESENQINDKVTCVILLCMVSLVIWM